MATLYTQILVQPVYNALIALYTTIGQQQAGLTLVLVGVLGGVIFLPAMITGYLDQRRLHSLQPEIDTIQQETADPEERQDKILKLLRRKHIRFQSESIFLFGQAVVLVLLYPVLIHSWKSLDSSLLYSFTPVPDSFSAAWGPLDLASSSPTASLVPAILLFFELRQSYKEQRFLTSLIDRWYPVILPLFVYFLMFWLPSGLSIVLAAALAVSLYVRILFWAATFWRHRRPSASRT